MSDDSVGTNMARLARASETLTGGKGDVALSYDGRGERPWYCGVAVKRPRERDRIVRATGASPGEAVREALRLVLVLTERAARA